MANDEFINNELEQHQRWLNSDEKKGKQADFSSRILKDKDLSEKDLRKVIFNHSALKNINFANSDLSNSDLSYTILKNINFKNTNLSNVNLSFAKSENSDINVAKFKNNINIHYSSYEFDELRNKEIQLSDNISKAKESLQISLQNTDKRLIENTNESNSLKTAVKWLFFIDIILLMILPFLLLNPLDWNLLSTIQYKFLLLSFTLKHWMIVFYTIPIITIFVIATSLLRHDKKIMEEIRYYTTMKHKIELFSGLLEASQHAARSFHNPERAEKYVEDTFTQIRNKLLEIENRPAKTKEVEDNSDIRTIDLLSKIVDLVNKVSK